MTMIETKTSKDKQIVWENLKNTFIQNNLDVNKKINLPGGGYKTILGLAIENKDDEFIKTILKNPALDANSYVYYKEKPYQIHVSNALQYAARYYEVDSEITKLISKRMNNTSDLIYFSK